MRVGLKANLNGSQFYHLLGFELHFEEVQLHPTNEKADLL